MGLFEKLGLKRTAAAITKRAILIKGATLSVAALTIVVGVTYTIAYFYEQSGSFTVNLNRYDMLQAGLSLSDNKEFTRPISRLFASPIAHADNISGKDLPANLSELEGENSSKNYICYSYYIRNSGKSTVSYTNSLNIENVSQNIDAAIRVMVYENGEPTIYAKIKSDNSGPEAGTIPFLSQTVAMQSTKREFGPGDMHKYTVVIWLEGDDPECVDGIIGGTMKLMMNVKIAETS